MQDYSGVTVFDTKRYGHWRPVIAAWQSAHARCAATTNEAAYWYTERTNVGVFAAAAWNSGLVAFEEYQVQKNHVTPLTGDPDCWFGRCDLAIEGEGFNEVMEVKQRRISLRSIAPASQVDRLVASAVHDTKCTLLHDTGEGTGLAFVLPYISAIGTTAGSLSDSITRFIEQLHKCDCGLLAWCFPSQSREFKWWNERDYMPGVVLVAKSASSG